MARYERMSTLFFVGIAIAICVESVRLGPGSLPNPGVGFVPLACGLILGILGLIAFVGTLKSTEEKTRVLWEKGTQWQKLIFALISLFGYAFFLNLLGFKLVTLLWMGFICRGVGKLGWMGTVFASVVTTFLCWLLFEYYLGTRFPHGIFGL